MGNAVLFVLLLGTLIGILAALANHFARKFDISEEQALRYVSAPLILVFAVASVLALRCYVSG